jgi:hypothetical protein
MEPCDAVTRFVLAELPWSCGYDVEDPIIEGVWREAHAKFARWRSSLSEI